VSRLCHRSNYDVDPSDLLYDELRLMQVSPLFSGHGISRLFHHPPWILHTLEGALEARDREKAKGAKGRTTMEVGDCFTIEPSVEQVSLEAGQGEMWKDGWTVVTKVGSRSSGRNVSKLLVANSFLLPLVAWY
jgi:methionine aminopeptidase